jgi:hypothetical protein
MGFSEQTGTFERVQSTHTETQTFSHAVKTSLFFVVGAVFGGVPVLLSKSAGSVAFSVVFTVLFFYLGWETRFSPAVTLDQTSVRFRGFFQRKSTVGECSSRISKNEKRNDELSIPDAGQN